MSNADLATAIDLDCAALFGRTQIRDYAYECIQMDLAAHHKSGCFCRFYTHL